ncbi:TRAP transporter permease [Acanthopleuribacter pedis]|uniref:TRAP transporter fused permease subunit n=1 Tax=Acanthopleuribacter pedis TaxID=442870 RepID=A0A8J7Q9J2_9BACT|nr:TRAP transporter fused permease subunit [Acanthopleuribacter pedis]MBO1320217.1 TRAP transporter fused permease subunit [Acanthopleuribacter pedis]
MLKPLFGKLQTGFGVALCLFVLAEVNYPRMQPHAALALFALFGLAMVFLQKPLHPRFAKATWSQVLDLVLVVASVTAMGYLVVQTEPLFKAWWFDGRPLGERAGSEVTMDFWMGYLGLALLFEGTRRAIGWTLPILSGTFLAYAFWGPALPDFLFPHRGYSAGRIVSQTFLHSQGVFGPALKVMFTFVFLFVLFGAVLEKTGATKDLIRLAQRIFGNSRGGPAKVAVAASGLMGSLSGSAVANTATTGTFTIPLMRSAGFPKTFAAAIEAASSSGGALVPPVMGAGAYMMLELVTPQVTFLQIIQAALIPAILYYLALFLLVHFLAGRFEAEATAKTVEADDAVAAATKMAEGPISTFKVSLFLAAFVLLIGMLVAGWTPFRSVTLAVPFVIGLAMFRPDTRLGFKDLIGVMRATAVQGIPLIVAAACVGVIIGVVTLTGLGIKFPALLIPMAESNLVLALLLMMAASLVLGMGLPSAVCYLLLATLMSPVLTDLGVVPLAAHFFIFYFGLMSMVTPPVALAAYTAASIADTHVMSTGWAAFRFAFAGFTLPFAFIFRPELLLLAPGIDHQVAAVGDVALALVFCVPAIVALAASLAGFWFRPLNFPLRLVLMALALLMLAPQDGSFGGLVWISLPAFLGIAGYLKFGTKK